MAWSEIADAAPVPMSGLLAFMERWAPGSTERLVPATPDQVAALAEHSGGTAKLPPVYRDFLETMGSSTGGFTLMWGTTAIGDLLEDLEDRERRRPDARRYLKFAIGEEDYNGRHPDDFFDLARPTPDRLDASILRVREADLLGGTRPPDAPFATFSDLLRSVFVGKLGLDRESKRDIVTVGFGRDKTMAQRVYDFLQRLGFSINDLGASRNVVPVEDPGRGALALITAPGPMMSGTLLELRARSETEQRILSELVTDHRKKLLGL